MSLIQINISALGDRKYDGRPTTGSPNRDCSWILFEELQLQVSTQRRSANIDSILFPLSLSDSRSPEWNPWINAHVYRMLPAVVRRNEAGGNEGGVEKGVERVASKFLGIELHRHAIRIRSEERRSTSLNLKLASFEEVYRAAGLCIEPSRWYNIATCEVRQEAYSAVASERKTDLHATKTFSGDKQEIWVVSYSLGNSRLP